MDESPDIDYDPPPFVGTPVKTTLRLITELCSALSPICRAATDASGSNDAAVTVHVLKKAEDILRQLDVIWADYLDEYIIYDEPFLEAKEHVAEVLATRRDSLTTLLTAHAWALRASNPLRGGQLPDVSSLLNQLYCALRVLVNDDASQSSAHRTMWTRLVRAFVATQPAEAAAAVVHAHRQRIAACRGEPAVEADALREATAAWASATQVASVYVQKQIGTGTAITLNFIHEVAVSGIAEQLCGLRVELAEGLERIWAAPNGSGGSGASASACANGDTGAGAQASTEDSVRSYIMDQLSYGDANLLEVLDEACKAYSTGSSDVVAKVTNTAAVHLSFGPVRPSDAAAAAAVLHPAVQYLLGWWLAVTAAAGARDGSSSSSSSSSSIIISSSRSRAWGLPEAMVRHVERMANPRRMSLMALRAAGVCWQQALRDGLARTSPRRRRRPAAAGPGLEGAGARAGAGSAAAAAAAAAGATAEGASDGAGQQPEEAAAAHGGGRHPVPYSPMQMYDMCLAALAHCCWWNRYDRQDDSIVYHCLSTALDAGVGVAVQCLLRMRPEQAACRLAAVWRVALQCADSAGKDPDRWGWRVAQLLCEVPLHLQQQRQGRQAQQEQGQGEAERAAGAGGSGSGSGRRAVAGAARSPGTWKRPSPSCTGSWLCASTVNNWWPGAQCVTTRKHAFWECLRPGLAFHLQPSLPHQYHLAHPPLQAPHLTSNPTARTPPPPAAPPPVRPIPWSALWSAASSPS